MKTTKTMNQQSHLSLIVGPLVILFGLGGLWFAGWLALNDPVALGLTLWFFYICYRGLKWLVN